MSQQYTEEEKQQIITDAAEQYGNFLTSLKINWQNEEHFKDTPRRVAKMLVCELWSGLYNKEPSIRSFPNTAGYDGVIYSGAINVRSTCAHHNVSVFGICHAAYLPSKDGEIIGLSKLNRIVDHHSSKPSTQENLTMDIFNHIDKVCKDNLGVALLIECRHMCCQMRGVKQNSIMKTSKMSGEFLNDKSLSRQEFYNFVADLKKDY